MASVVHAPGRRGGSPGARSTRAARLAWCAVLLSSPLLAPCGREGPAAPGLHSISGHVVLRGYLVGSTGAFAGTRVIGDADGVPVELVQGTRVIARTTTVDGVYRFSGLGPGGYVARSRVMDGVGDDTAPLTIAVRDVAAADTLRLYSVGDLYPVPNPAQPSTVVFYGLADSTQVLIRVLDIAGETVRTIVDGGVSAGTHTVYWGGTGLDGNPAPPGLYWITLVAGTDRRAQLLFR
jgi:hypothetical protein